MDGGLAEGALPCLWPIDYVWNTIHPIGLWGVYQRRDTQSAYHAPAANYGSISCLPALFLSQQSSRSAKAKMVVMRETHHDLKILISHENPGECYPVLVYGIQINKPGAQSPSSYRAQTIHAHKMSQVWIRSLTFFECHIYCVVKPFACDSVLSVSWHLIKNNDDKPSIVVTLQHFIWIIEYKGTSFASFLKLRPCANGS